MTEPITVIIPAYGPGPHLEEVVASLDQQLDGECRIVIAHSGAVDPTARFASNARVTVLHSSDRLFAGAAGIRGMAIADTEWLAFVDEDVVPAEDWYASIRRSLEKETTDCIVGSIGYQTKGGYWDVALVPRVRALPSLPRAASGQRRWIVQYDYSAAVVYPYGWISRRVALCPGHGRTRQNGRDWPFHRIRSIYRCAAS